MKIFLAQLCMAGTLVLSLFCSLAQAAEPILSSNGEAQAKVSNAKSTEQAKIEPTLDIANSLMTSFPAKDLSIKKSSVNASTNGLMGGNGGEGGKGGSGGLLIGNGGSGGDGGTAEAVIGFHPDAGQASKH